MLGVPSALPAVCLDVVLVLDQSGSMKQNDPQRLLVAAATDFVGRLAPDDAASLVLFGTQAKATFPLTPLSQPAIRTALLEEIRRIRYDAPRTNIAAGIERGLYELRARGRADATPVLVFITDGIMDSGSSARDAEMREWLRTRLLQDARARGAKLFSVALTEQADYALIQEMATATGGDYYRALGVTEIGGIFGRISAKLRSPSGPTVASSGPFPAVPVSVSVPASPPMLALTGFWVAMAAVFTLLLAGGAIVTRRLRRTLIAGRGGKGVEATQMGKAAAIAPPLEASLRDMRTGREIRLVRPLVRVGRAPDNDIVLAESQVSGHHAEIECRQGRFFLRDLRSTNGTSVNRRPVSGETILRPGDVIGFDEVSFTFRGAQPVLAGTVLRDLREVIPGGAGPPPVPEPPAVSGTVLMGTESTVDDSVGPAHCPMHPTFEATERCDVCGKLWCALCNPPVKGERACRHCRESRRAVASETGSGGGGPATAG
jgi:hypothetical protein